MTETSPADALRTVAYGLFALQQAVPMRELNPEAAGVRLRSQPTGTPDWFAAAAEGDASLLEMAPELIAMGSATGEAPEVERDADIIGMYAPDSPRASRPGARPEPASEPTPEPTEASPRTSQQIGLLRELDALDP